ncbi:MAG: hypothetical protein RJQ09_17725 [Cyclobacteriaceae bacterium]
MKANLLKNVFTLMGGIMLFSILPINAVLAQEGNPDYYFDNYSEDYVSDETSEQEDNYSYDDEYYADETMVNTYNEEEIQEDTTSLSALTFNFLFYMVYKLKFSEEKANEGSSKTADD